MGLCPVQALFDAGWWMKQSYYICRRHDNLKDHSYAGGRSNIQKDTE